MHAPLPSPPLHVPAFAAGEVRGYSKLALSASKLSPSTSSPRAVGTAAAAVSGPSVWPGGRGLLEVKKVLYGLAKPYISRIESTGDPANDWQLFFGQSEQVPTFVHLHVDHAPPSSASGSLAPSSTSTSSSTSASSPASVSLGGAAGAEAKSAADGAAGAAPATGRAVRPIPFCGGVLVQVLAGPPDPRIAGDALAQAKSAVATSSSSSSSAPATDGESAGEGKAEEGVDVEESEAARVKRLQLEHISRRVLQLDMRALMEEYGVVGYLRALLGEDPASVDVDVAAASSPETDAPTSTTTASPSSSSPISPSSSMDFEALDTLCKTRGWVYRQDHFFCRCSQIPAKERIVNLPRSILDELRGDGGATFTCDYCAASVTASVSDIDDVIAKRDSSRSGGSSGAAQGGKAGSIS